MKYLLLLLLLTACDYHCDYADDFCMDTDGTITGYGTNTDSSIPDQWVNWRTLEDSCDILGGDYSRGLCD
jgi:hypothetical protein